MKISRKVSRLKTHAEWNRSTPSTRLAPHDKLSRTQLRKRLHAAGYKGAALARLVAEILAGPTQDGGFLGRTKLGWNIEVFEKQFGRKVARAVFAFVRLRFVALDEAYALFNSDEAAAEYKRMLGRWRKHFAPAPATDKNDYEALRLTQGEINSLKTEGHL